MEMGYSVDVGYTDSSDYEQILFFKGLADRTDGCKAIHVEIFRLKSSKIGIDSTRQSSIGESIVSEIPNCHHFWFQLNKEDSPAVW